MNEYSATYGEAYDEICRTNRMDGKDATASLFRLLNYCYVLETRVNQLEAKLEVLIDVVDDLRG